MAAEFDLVRPPLLGVDTPEDARKEGEDHDQRKAQHEGGAPGQVGHRVEEVTVGSPQNLQVQAAWLMV